MRNGQDQIIIEIPVTDGVAVTITAPILVVL